MSHQAMTKLADLLVQALTISQDSLGPGDDAGALRREAFEAPAALDDGHREFAFKLLEGGGQRRLGDTAGRRRPAEVTFPRKGSQIDKLAQKHGAILAGPRVRWQAIA